MAKRNDDQWNSDIEQTEVEEPEVEYVILCLMKDVKLRIIGPVTGKEYFFDGAGSELYVDSRDAEQMIKKVSARTCCSGMNVYSPYFTVR